MTTAAATRAGSVDWVCYPPPPNDNLAAMKDRLPHFPKGERRASVEAELHGVLMIFTVGGMFPFLFGS